jgi:ribosome-associated protein
MIRVTHTIELPEEEILLEFTRSSGPGGQHVNKTETAVDLRFAIPTSRALTDAVKRRLLKLAGNRVDQTGVLLISAQSYRSQRRNIDEAIERLCELIRRAAVPPRPRRPTRPTKASKERRLTGKKVRADTKRGRRGLADGGNSLQ